MNDEAVYRTAPATPGLLNTVPTKGYGPLYWPSSSFCRGLQSLAQACVALRAKSYFWNTCEFF